MIRRPQSPRAPPRPVFAAPVFAVAGTAIGAVTTIPFLRQASQERAAAISVPEREPAAHW